MESIKQVSEHQVRLTDQSIASLLGISLEEYLSLSHKPIQAYTDINGEVTEFYIHVSTNNNPRILSKLNLDKSNFIRFKPEEVYRMYV
jgi:hypothetical protein